jgi:hypothetical protein
MWMEAANPFAQVPSTPEPIIAQVRRQLADDDPVGMWVSVGVLDRVADHAVRELWSSRVKTFVPVLALRTAREILREQDLLISMEQLERRLVGVPPAAMLPREERQPRDVLPIAGDVVSIDDRDVLHL